jgi:FtsP/CotA-like multicopper oxidase with cupredoxin domain
MSKKSPSAVDSDAKTAGIPVSPLRRNLLKTLGFSGGSAIFGIAGLTLESAVLGGSAVSVSGVAQAATNAAAINIQSRKIQWVSGRSPSVPNAWVFVTGADTTSSGVLASPMGPTLSYRRDAPTSVTWTSNLVSDSTRTILAAPPINAPVGPDICGYVQTQSDVGVAVHLHGARVQAAYDGWPLTPLSFTGNPYAFPSSAVFVYPNAQRSSMLWYHDHALDRTGRHVHAGLAGVYFIRDSADDSILASIGGAAQELLCVVQDRILSSDSLSINYASGMPIAPVGFERPEFLGSTVFVNGKPSPTVAVARRTYRLRVLNASNARTYAFALVDMDALARSSGRVWYTDCLRVIGADAGLVSTSVQLGATQALVVTSGQRRDVLIDLSSVPSTVTKLRLVNIGLKPENDAYSNSPSGMQIGPVAIFSDSASTVFAPTSQNFSTADSGIYAWLTSALPVAQVSKVQDFSLSAGAVSGSTTSPTATAINTILASTANDDDFVWSASTGSLSPKSGIAFGPNRLVLLMGNTTGTATATPINNVSGWSDVQIMEMSSGQYLTSTDRYWPFAFDISAQTTNNPAAGTPTFRPINYKLARKSFFASETNSDITVTKRYPALAAPTISAKAGTYERWYVANIGNNLAASGTPRPVADPLLMPDMHPFHVHMVSQVVLRRWVLNAFGVFVLKTSPAIDLDRQARQDTVRVESNELVEILVYYPPGYVGNYVYHCHLLEHEDMCMMSHFKVS